ncbi:50S ribosomal protein L6 [Pleionea mediterranea]|jgi:large subunit ribosomal protein L6|uniref:Large ribosomal subunit protein uL6 n=1 Tax=Pleionea mediterranea TaxID=523701 RepID=A0A316GBQ1_9GAMM|nr:50S ribosomal protein L6 [Pleionea mediterranea]PWK51937.1 LSU ribosomal protein L6P [Pleionea mediterranea]
MSRVANYPVSIPSGVNITLSGQEITVKGSKGELKRTVHDAVEIKQQDEVLTFAPREGIADARAFAGTMRSLVNNMVVGVSDGFEKKLQLVGVGYRAQAKGKVLSLTLGFSHPVDYEVPEGITIETPSNTDVIVKGADKQLVGQVAANIRAYRPPEPYKGKGVRYVDEYIRRKEAKKK